MSDVEAIWQELATSALLGTNRRTPELPCGGGALEDLLSRLDSSNPQHLLLEAAAVVAMYRRAGRLPSIITAEELLPCEADDQPICNLAAAARLRRMLDGDYEDLIPEWLSLASASNTRLPEELLPDLLDWGENHSDQAELLLPIIGKRGRWLAPQNPRWETVATIADLETIPAERAAGIWQTGAKKARRQVLRRLRLTAPKLACDMVNTTWKEESAEDRGVFLTEFESGLSMGDELFLEAALDDRSKEVRQIAARLLARLAESNFVKRQITRAQPLLKWKPGGFLRKAQIEVRLPEACDKEMVRDGIEPKPPRGAGIGEKAWWLKQVLSAVPPSYWSRLWKVRPSDLVEAAAEGDWRSLLVESWEAAALNHHDVDWAEALLKAYPTKTPLLNILPLQPREDFLTALLESKPLEGITLLTGFSHPWSPAFSRSVLKHLRRYYLAGDNLMWTASLRYAFQTIGRCIDPSIYTEVAKILNEKAGESLLEVLDFRRQMIEELS